MQILLLVLKIIGLVILGLLGLVVFLLLLVLFWPIRYRAEVSYHEEPVVKVRAGWMGVVAFKLDFKEKKLLYRLSVLGFALKEKGKEEAGHGAGKKKKPFRDKNTDLKAEQDLPDEGMPETENKPEGMKEAENKVHEPAKNLDRGKMHESSEQSAENEPMENQSEKKQPIKSRTGDSGSRDGQKASLLHSALEKIREVIKKIKSLFLQLPVKIRTAVDKVRNIFISIREKITALWNKILSICHKIKKIYGFIALAENRSCAKEVLKMAGRLLKHISPRKIKGYVRFGLEDPCSTGKVLGILGMFYGVYGEKIRIYPEFEEPCLDGEILIKGYMQVGVILFHALKIYISKELKTLKYNYQKLKEEL